MDKSRVAGVILAGGKGSRMQHPDKPLLPLAGKSLIAHVIDRARPQVADLIVSVNSDLPAYRGLNLPLVPDADAPQQGPLLGICTAIEWYRTHQPGNVDYVACFPADVPVFPDDLVTSLMRAIPMPRTVGGYQSSFQPDSSPPAGSAPGAAESDSTGDESLDPVIWLRTGDQVQPLFSLWPVTVFSSLRTAVKRGIHGPRLFFSDYPNQVLQLPAAEPPLFLNINSRDELARAESLLAAH